MSRPRSAAGPLDRVTQHLQLTDDALPLVALDFDAPVLDRSPGPAPLLQGAGEFPQATLAQVEVEHGGHALPPPAGRLPPDLDRERLLGRLGRCPPCRGRFGGPVLRPCAAAAEDAGDEAHDLPLD